MSEQNTTENESVIEISADDVVVKETIIKEDSNNENDIKSSIKDKTSDTYKKIKFKTDETMKNYNEYKKTENEDFAPQTKSFSDKVSWDLIKVLSYIFIMSFIINDIQNFLFSSTILLLFIKLDVLEPLCKFIRSIFRKK